MKSILKLKRQGKIIHKVKNNGMISYFIKIFYCLPITSKVMEGHKFYKTKDYFQSSQKKKKTLQMKKMDYQNILLWIGS